MNERSNEPAPRSPADDEPEPTASDTQGVEDCCCCCCCDSEADCVLEG